MRSKLLCVTILSLLCVLAGCGKAQQPITLQQPEASELGQTIATQELSPIPTEEPDTMALSTDGVLRILNGGEFSFVEAIQADLDQDGKSDDIRIEITPDDARDNYYTVQVWVNNMVKEYRHIYEAASTMEQKLITYDGEHIAILLTCSDAVGYDSSYIFVLKDDVLHEEYIWGQVVGYNSTTGKLKANTLVNQIDWHPVCREYQVHFDENGVLKVMEEYAFMEYEQVPKDNYKTAMEIIGYEEKDETSDQTIVPAGTTVELLAGDGTAWVYVYLKEADIYCYIRVVNALIDTPQGEEQSIYEVFEGLQAVS